MVKSYPSICASDNGNTTTPPRTPPRTPVHTPTHTPDHTPSHIPGKTTHPPSHPTGSGGWDSAYFISGGKGGLYTKDDFDDNTTTIHDNSPNGADPSCQGSDVIALSKCRNIPIKYSQGYDHAIKHTCSNGQGRVQLIDPDNKTGKVASVAHGPHSSRIKDAQCTGDHYDSTLGDSKEEAEQKYNTRRDKLANIIANCGKKPHFSKYTALHQLGNGEQSCLIKSEAFNDANVDPKPESAMTNGGAAISWGHGVGGGGCGAVSLMQQGPGHDSNNPKTQGNTVLHFQSGMRSFSGEWSDTRSGGTGYLLEGVPGDKNTTCLQPRFKTLRYDEVENLLDTICNGGGKDWCQSVNPGQDGYCGPSSAPNKPPIACDGQNEQDCHLFKHDGINCNWITPKPEPGHTTKPPVTTKPGHTTKPPVTTKPGSTTKPPSDKCGTCEQCLSPDGNTCIPKTRSKNGYHCQRHYKDCSSSTKTTPPSTTKPHSVTTPPSTPTPTIPAGMKPCNIKSCDDIDGVVDDNNFSCCNDQGACWLPSPGCPVGITKCYYDKKRQSDLSKRLWDKCLKCAIIKDDQFVNAIDNNDHTKNWSDISDIYGGSNTQYLSALDIAKTWIVATDGMKSEITGLPDGGCPSCVSAVTVALEEGGNHANASSVDPNCNGPRNMYDPTFDVNGLCTDGDKCTSGGYWQVSNAWDNTHTSCTVCGESCGTGTSLKNPLCSAKVAYNWATKPEHSQHGTNQCTINELNTGIDPGCRNGPFGLWSDGWNSPACSQLYRQGNANKPSQPFGIMAMNACKQAVEDLDTANYNYKGSKDITNTVIKKAMQHRNSPKSGYTQPENTEQGQQCSCAGGPCDT